MENVLLDKLTPNELGIYYLLKKNLTIKDISKKVNKHRYEIEQTLKLIICKLNINSRVDIRKNRFDTRNPKNNRNYKNVFIKKRKKIESLKRKDEVLRYRFIKDYGYSTHIAMKNMSKKRFDKFCKENNLIKQNKSFE